MDESVFDEDHRMLKTVLERVSSYLADHGKLFLLFSDLSFQLGLTENNLVEKLCEKNALKVIKFEKEAEYKGDTTTERILKGM